MCALSKLAVGSDAGTSRPAMAPQHTRPPAKKQQNAEPAHSILQYLNFQDAQGTCSPTALWAASNSQHPQTSASISCGASYATRPARSSALPAYRSTAAGTTHATLQQQQLSSTLLAHVAAVAAADASAAVPTNAAARAGPAPAACSSRPVTPHATKPYRSMPALSTLLQHSSLTTSSCSRPATAAGRLLHPHGGSSSTSSSRTGQFLARPATASSSSCGLVTSRDSWKRNPAGSGSTEALQLRPGSAAAAKILRAMDKACVATPSTAAARAAVRRPTGVSCSAQQAAAGMQPAQPAVQMLLQQPQRTLCTAPMQSDQQASVHPVAAADDPGLGSLRADTQTDQDYSSSRPSTAAVQSILSAAAAAEDGVEARLAAIREKNSRNDHSAGLDIVTEEETVLEELPCGGQGAANAINVAEGLTADDAGAAEMAALGGQAGAMVLNLEDFSLCTPEVLEIELESLDVEQLMQLRQLL